MPLMMESRLKRTPDGWVVHLGDVEILKPCPQATGRARVLVPDTGPKFVYLFRTASIATRTHRIRELLRARQ